MQCRAISARYRAPSGRIVIERATRGVRVHDRVGAHVVRKPENVTELVHDHRLRPRTTAREHVYDRTTAHPRRGAEMRGSAARHDDRVRSLSHLDEHRASGSHVPRLERPTCFVGVQISAHADRHVRAPPTRTSRPGPLVASGQQDEQSREPHRHQHGMKRSRSPSSTRSGRLLGTTDRCSDITASLLSCSTRTRPMTQRSLRHISDQGSCARSCRTNTPNGGCPDRWIRHANAG